MYTIYLLRTVEMVKIGYTRRTAKVRAVELAAKYTRRYSVIAERKAQGDKLNGLTVERLTQSIFNETCKRCAYNEQFDDHFFIDNRYSDATLTKIFNDAFFKAVEIVDSIIQ